MATKMIIPRTIGRTLTLTQHNMGANFKAARISGDDLPVSPVLNIDWFDMKEPKFRPHPHAGFSAVTYIFPDSATSVLNRDSRGHQNFIHPGEMHWTTAGSGIVHEETPVDVGKSCLGLQVFVNLPPELKNVAPRSDHLSKANVPVASTPGGGSVRVLTGSAGGVTSPIKLVYPLTFLDATLPPGASFEEQVPEGDHVLALVVKGSVQVAGQEVLQQSQAAALVGGSQAVQLQSAGEGEAQVVLFWGKPIDAPVLWRGPFCGNSVEQIAGWMNAYQSGRMGKLEASF